jgi:transcriptional regulator with XRE-family HTH domain
MDYSLMAIGENLKRLRQDKGYTQYDLSKKSGVRIASISQIERNEGDPKLSTLYKLIDGLECSADALLLDINHISLNATMKTMLERAEQLPEREKTIIMDIIDTYCITHGFEQVVDQGWRKFAIITKESKKDKVIDEINK